MDQKITQLTAYTTPQPNDVSPIVDVSIPETKKITFTNLATGILNIIQASLGGLVQSVTGLNTDNSDPANPVVQISVDGVTITGDGTPGNPLVATAGAGGSGGGVNQKIKSYSLEGLEGTPIPNGSQNVEAYITVDGTTVYAEFSQEFLQSRDVTADWVDADEVISYAVFQGFLFLLLKDNGAPAYRVYRYDITDLASGGSLMTIAGQAFSTQDGMMMATNSTDFFFNYKGGNSANDYVISKYTISGTTLTYGSDITCGAVLHATDLFGVFDNENIYGLNITGVRQFKHFDNTGTLQNTFGPFDTNYTNMINWDETIYIVKSTGDDEAYRVSLETDNFSGSGGSKLAINTSNVTVSAGDPETTLYSIPIPGGTLGTNDAIRFKVLGNLELENNVGVITYRVKYGATTVATVIADIGTFAGDWDSPFFLEGMIIADGATNAQKNTATLIIGQQEFNADGAIVSTEGANSAEDSTGTLNLVITAECSNTGAPTATETVAIVVERIF